MRVAFTVLICCLSNLSMAQERATEPAFKVVQPILKEIVKLHVVDGQLRVRRDQWELAAKRPFAAEERLLAQEKAEEEANKKNRQATRERLERLKMDEKQIERQLQMFGRTSPFSRTTMFRNKKGVARLFNRLYLATGQGGYSGGGRQVGRVNESCDTSLLYAGIKTTDSTFLFHATEKTPDGRSISLSEEPLSRKLMLRWPNGDLFFLYQRDGGVICVVIRDDTNVRTASSFAALVQRDTALMRETVNPMFEDFGLRFPVDAAAAVADVDVAASPMFTEATDAEPGELGGADKQFGELADFDLEGGKLQLNRFSGNSDYLRREVESVLAAHKEALDQALQRLENRGAPASQAQQLKEAVKLSPFRASTVGSPRESPIVRRFNVFRRAFLLGGGGGGGGGGVEYNLEYTARDRVCAVSGKKNQALITAQDATHEVAVAENRDQNFCSITIESAGQLLMLLQSKKGCLVLKCREGAMQKLEGTDYLSLFVDQEEPFRKDIFPDFTRIGLTSLDPFNKRIVDLISQTLTKGLPSDFDANVPVTADEARVFPALMDERYLKALHDRTTDADRKKLLSDRIGELAKQLK